MTKFRKTVRNRIIWSIVEAVVAAAAFFIVYFVTDGMGHLPSFIQGFNAGVFSAMEVVCIIMAVSYAVSLRNEEKLKKLYIEETDERTVLIQQKSGAATLNIIVFCLLLAAIVAGFFNQIVFFTLLACVAFIMLIWICTKLYYKHQLE
jgi:uncharacterized membrane protein